MAWYPALQVKTAAQRTCADHITPRSVSFPGFGSRIPAISVADNRLRGEQTLGPRAWNVVRTVLCAGIGRAIQGSRTGDSLRGVSLGADHVEMRRILRTMFAESRTLFYGLSVLQSEQARDDHSWSPASLGSGRCHVFHHLADRRLHSKTGLGTVAPGPECMAH